MKKEMEKDKKIQTHKFQLSFPESFEISVKEVGLTGVTAMILT